MAGPIPNRPIPRSKKAEPTKRALTAKEKRSRRTANLVTWFLVFVFSVTSVGFLIGIKSQDQGPEAKPETAKQQLLDKLKAIQQQAAEKPDEPQFHYEQARIYLELSQVRGEGQSQANLDKAIEQYKVTLKVSPSFLPALQELADIYLYQGKNREAAEILTQGIAAETKELAQRNAELRASKASPEAEIPPDAKLRAQLYRAEVSMPGHQRQAAEAAREAMKLNPRVFMMALQQTVIELALSGKEDKKATAREAIQIALKEAEALQDGEVVLQIKQLQDAIAKMSVQRPSPAVGASAAPVIPGASAAPASPGATANPLASPSAAAGTPEPGAPVPVSPASPAPTSPGSATAPAPNPSSVTVPVPSP